MSCARQYVDALRAVSLALDAAPLDSFGPYLCVMVRSHRLRHQIASMLDGEPTVGLWLDAYTGELNGFEATRAMRRQFLDYLLGYWEARS